MTKVHVTRRELIASATVAGAFAAVPPAWGRRLLSRRPRVGPGAFLDGVASGEPTASAVTFWSRLDTARPRSGARLIVAEDPGMRRVVATAVVPTGRGINGTLKARIGGLNPHTEYFYLWESGTQISEIGRTRTAPAPDAATSLRIAYSSCQQYPLGFFAAHQNIAGIPDLDLCLFLGDYVYERGAPAGRILRPDGIEAVDLASYRAKYALYRGDASLRELHRLHPVAHIWDDHEVSNNYSNTTPPAPAAQRAAAYRAAFEWLPRMTVPNDRFRLYKKLSFGTVADLFLLDERQYRTGFGDGQPRRMLGDAQLSWLVNSIKGSPATWKVIANQVVMASGLRGEDDPESDAWNGFVEDRALLLGELERVGVKNVVVLTGDAHVFMTNLLAADFERLADDDEAVPAAVEYVGGSVTSPNGSMDELTVQDNAPWNIQYDSDRHGYAYAEITAEALVTEYRASDRTRPTGQTTAFERFVQPAGTNRPQRTPINEPRRTRARTARRRTYGRRRTYARRRRSARRRT